MYNYSAMIESEPLMTKNIALKDIHVIVIVALMITR